MPEFADVQELDDTPGGLAPLPMSLTTVNPRGNRQAPIERGRAGLAEA